jgi:hypothetical protein
MMLHGVKDTVLDILRGATLINQRDSQNDEG